jgi:hypothetical protein
MQCIAMMGAEVLKVGDHIDFYYSISEVERVYVG